MSLVSIPAAAAPLHRRVLDYDEDPLHAQPPSECRSESTVELTSESPDLRYLGCTSRVMPESIAELNYAVTDDQGRQYFPTVVGELIGNRWEAWLEFVPTDDSAPLLTNTETHQSTREDVVRWATLLDDVYLEGAFRRAVQATASAPPAIRSPISVLHPLPIPIDSTGRFEDPFEMYRLGGKEGLRAKLQPLARSELMLIIDNFRLNPARLSLARLTKSQLVTFIATAVEVQISQGRG